MGKIFLAEVKIQKELLNSEFYSGLSSPFDINDKRLIIVNDFIKSSNKKFSRLRFYSKSMKMLYTDKILFEQYFQTVWFPCKIAFKINDKNVEIFEKKAEKY
ncbi:hypothetical protein AAEX28_14630 [Lentisphaerota bacterium WC36G]|nr:hypothetical protein LJT99_01385 [Lentisphaerae bacterium WC36]